MNKNEEKKKKKKMKKRRRRKDSRKELHGFIPVPGGPVNMTRGGDLCIMSHWCDVSTSQANARPSTATASPAVLTSTRRRSSVEQWTRTAVAGPTNLW